MNNNCWTKNGYTIRLAQTTDAENYYLQNYNPLDKEISRLTGCKEHFSRDEVISFFLKSIKEIDRYYFLIISPDNRIIGETVINEIDTQTKSANFRICIFQSSEQGKGIGTWAVDTTRDFAFDVLKLHRLSLDVFSFNTQAEKCYLKAGFKREGVLRDAILNGNEYADDILMSIMENEWLGLKRNMNYEKQSGLPSRKEAEEILKEAENKNPGLWGAHSRNVAIWRRKNSRRLQHGRG